RLNLIDRTRAPLQMDPLRTPTPRTAAAAPGRRAPRSVPTGRRRRRSGAAALPGRVVLNQAAGLPQAVQPTWIWMIPRFRSNPPPVPPLSWVPDGLGAGGGPPAAVGSGDGLDPGDGWPGAGAGVPAGAGDPVGPGAGPPAPEPPGAGEPPGDGGPPGAGDPGEPADPTCSPVHAP